MSPRFGVDLNASNSLLTALPINIASSGSNTLIAGVAGQIIRVWKLFLVTATAVTVQFLDGSNALSGVMSLGTNGQLVLDFNTTEWFVTSPGNSFNINLGSGVQCSGAVYYTQG